MIVEPAKTDMVIVITFNHGLLPGMDSKAQPPPKQQPSQKLIFPCVLQGKGPAKPGTVIFNPIDPELDQGILIIRVSRGSDRLAPEEKNAGTVVPEASGRTLW